MGLQVCPEARGHKSLAKQAGDRQNTLVSKAQALSTIACKQIRCSMKSPNSREAWLTCRLSSGIGKRAMHAGNACTLARLEQVDALIEQNCSVT